MLSESCEGVLLKSGFCRGWISPSDILRNQPHLVIMGSGFAFGWLVVSLVSDSGILNYSFVSSYAVVIHDFFVLTHV